MPFCDISHYRACKLLAVAEKVKAFFGISKEKKRKKNKDRE